MSHKKGAIHCSIGEKDYLNIQETMAYLDLSEYSLTRMVEDGLKRIELGNKVLFSKKSIANYLDAKEGS